MFANIASFRAAQPDVAFIPEGRIVSADRVAFLKFAIGGAAQYYARCIKKVTGVDFLEEMGVPEAMWHLEVEAFPAIVTMDSHGNSLHRRIEDDSFASLSKLADDAH